MQELQKLFKTLYEYDGTTEGITRCLGISNGKFVLYGYNKGKGASRIVSNFFRSTFVFWLIMLSHFQSMNSRMQ